MWLCSLPSSPPVLTRCSEYAAHKLPSSRPPVGVVSTQSSHHNVGFWRRAEDVAEAPAGGEELIDAGQARINGEKGRGAVARGVGVGACARRSVWGQVRQRGDRTHSHEIPSARSTTHPRHVHDTSATRPRHVHDMCMSTTRPRHVRDTSATCPRHVHDMSQPCPQALAAAVRSDRPDGLLSTVEEEGGGTDVTGGCDAEESYHNRWWRRRAASPSASPPRRRGPSHE